LIQFKNGQSNHYKRHLLTNIARSAAINILLVYGSLIAAIALTNVLFTTNLTHRVQITTKIPFSSVSALFYNKPHRFITVRTIVMHFFKPYGLKNFG